MLSWSGFNPSFCKPFDHIKFDSKPPSTIVEFMAIPNAWLELAPERLSTIKYMRYILYNSVYSEIDKRRFVKQTRIILCKETFVRPFCAIGNNETYCVVWLQAMFIATPIKNTGAKTHED